MNRSDYILIVSTASSKEEAHKIISHLLEKRWVACASIYDQVTSIYFWNNAVEKSVEVEMHFKTKEAFFSKIVTYIEAVHSYEVPQILKMPITGANDSYLLWLEANLNKF